MYIPNERYIKNDVYVKSDKMFIDCKGKVSYSNNLALLMYYLIALYIYYDEVILSKRKCEVDKFF